MPTHEDEGQGDRAPDAGTPGDREPGAAEPRPKLFVSYTPADEDWASWISWQLESAGYHVTLQAWDFVPGTRFIELMDRGVADAAAVIAVLSQSYLSSRFGRLEWQAAMLANPDDPSTNLITVRVRECSLTGLLSNITYVDLAVPLQEQQARRLLLERVRHSRAGRAKPDTAPAFPSGARPAPAPAPADGQPGTAREREAERQLNLRRPLIRPVYPPDRQRAKPSSDGLAILHVPGPRFGRGRPGPDVPSTASELQARLWADVNRMLDAGAPRPDLVVVSGNLTESGAVREFDEASEFLTGLRTLLGLKPDRCVVVPGSSDLSRLACRAYFDLCAADDVAPQPPYWQKWRHFTRTFAELYRDIDGVAFEVPQPWTLYAVPDLRVVIAGLNSTIAETHRPQDRYGELGEVQATWFAEKLRPYAEKGWLRLAAVAHDPALLRDSPATGQLLSSHVNLLLHGQSGRDIESPPGGTDPGSTDSGDGPWSAPLLTVAAGRTGAHELVHLTADGLTRWRVEDATARSEVVRHVWRSAAATFPPGISSEPPADAREDPLPSRQRPGDEVRRVASPVEQLLDQIAEVIEAARSSTRVRRIESADGPSHLLITLFQEGFAHQRRIAAHVGAITQDVIEAFAAQVHTGEAQVDAELVCTGPRPEQQLRSLAQRRGIRLRTFTEFQGLLDLRDYVTGQATRLESDQRYPHALYVPQRYRDLEAQSTGVRENVVEDLLRQLAIDSGRFILVLGDFGRGKTFALRELARQIPERLRHLIPIYVELRELDKAHSVDALVAAHLASHGEDVIDLKAFRYMLQQGRIVLLFDGFDELATRVTYDRAADHLQALVAATEGKAKIIVASRTQHFRSQEQVFTALGERVGQLPGRLVLGIEDFTDDQVRSYLANLYGEERAADERLRLISTIENLPALSGNPRMLSFIAALDADRLRSVAGARGTLSAAGLYQVILDAWLSYEHERTHGIPGAPAGLSLDDLWQLVTVLALRLNDSGETIIRLDDLTDEVAASLTRLADGQLTAQQGAHAIGAGSLLVRVEDGVFGFIHSSVAEWLVARQIAASLADPDGLVAALERRPLSPLTIDFLCDLAAPLELRRWVVGVLEGPGPKETGAGGAARANALRLNARIRIPARSDLRGAQLRGENLSHREFVQVDFTGADLTGARLIGANLADANLSGAKLVRARLDFTLLPGASLRGADLTGARLTRADLTGAELGGSRWNRAAIIDATGLPPDALTQPELRGAAIMPGMPVRTEIAPADIGVPFGYDENTARLPEPIAYSPDGGLLAVANSDGGVTLCDVETGLPVRTLRGHQDRVYSTRFALGGQVLVTAASDATLRLWDIPTGESTVIPVPGAGAWPCEVSPDGELFAYGAPDGIIRVLDVASGQIRHQLPGHASLVYTAAFAGAGEGLPGRRLLTGDRAGVVRMWDLDSENLLMRFGLPDGAVYRLLATGIASARGAPLYAAAGSAGTLLVLDEQGAVTRLEGHAGSIYTLDLHPSRPLLASGDTKGEVRLWDLAAGSQWTALASHPDAVYGVTFSPDGSQLATAYLDGHVRITTVADGWTRHELIAHRSAVWRPLFRPDGTQLATASIDGTCRLWDTATGQPRNVVRGHGRRVSSVTFSADGALLAAGGNDGVVRVWDPVTGRQRHVVTGEADRLVSAVFSPVGALLAAASNDGGVYLLNADTGLRDREMNMDTERVWAETFSPDGTVLATANDDDSVRLWYRSTGRNTLSITGHRGRVRSLSFSPDGALLATGCDDRLVRVWDASTGDLRAKMPGHTDRVYAVAFNPDGTLLASAGNDGAAYLWDPLAGTSVLRLEQAGGRLWTAAFSPAGDVLATAGDDGVIRLWSVPDGTLLRGLEGHTGRVAAIAFSSGTPGTTGPLLASASDDGTVRLWEMTAEQALRATLLGTSDGWAAFAADGRYKADGAMTGQFWHVIGLCRFEPGDLDPYVPGITRLSADAPF